ncbi:hypothetical protein PF011_g15389 [Phytophthora fragariae]|uniref:Protein kinase domain-containing protein n=1 Tax=Phytophthora fragariae TaxID=53985 RepID=A0A6A3JQR2_9STRA|nr:hypothetical protein PF011_g15389 [Phytophthora fragariae]
MSEEAKTQMQEVEDSAWVSRWLVEDYGTQTNSESSSSKGINLTLLLPIIGGVVVVIALVCLLVFIKRRRKQRCEDVPVEDNPATPNAVCQGWSDGKQVHGSSRSDTRVCFAETQATVDDTETTSRRLAQEALKRNSAFERDTSSESNVTLKTLLCSEHLVEKRIPFEKRDVRAADKDQKRFVVLSTKGSSGSSTGTITPEEGVHWLQNRVRQRLLRLKRTLISSFAATRSRTDRCHKILAMEERHLASSDSSGNAELPSSGSSFEFDGTNSDIARQLYYRAKAGDSASPIEGFNVPSTLQARLDDLQLDWEKLPGIAQRALLWDSGYGLSPTDEPVKIWTLGGHSMADLAVPLEEFLAVNCTEHVCPQPDDTTSLSNQQCTGGDMLRAARCVVEDFVQTIEIHLAMWVTGGNPTVVPTPRIYKHAWNDSLDHNSYVVFAVHTVKLEFEPAWNECATADQNEGYGSLVLPCHTTANISNFIDDAKQEVQGSAWVTRWLVDDYLETAGTASSSGHNSNTFNLMLLVPIVAGVVVAIGLVGLFVFIKRRRQKRTEQFALEESPVCPRSYYRDCVDAQFAAEEDSTMGRSTAPTIEDTMTISHRKHPAGSNLTLKILLESEFLAGKRVPYESIFFKQALSKGANGEVWLCHLHDQQVAVKRLLQNTTHLADEVQEFAQEIELSASLVHPNIVSFQDPTRRPNAAQVGRMLEGGD